MSLEDLHTEVAALRAQAGELSEHFTRTHAEVTADDGLTLAGKRERLEPLHQEVTEKIAALHKSEKAAVRGMKEKLERRVFGLSPSASNDPAKLVSYRDAASRARELDDQDDAAELYESAKRSGDTILAAAVMERGMVRGWTSITRDYLERNTASKTDLDDLTALAKYSDNPLAVTAQYMPPSLNLPHSAGFPRLGGQTTAPPVRGVPSLADTMTRRLGSTS
ncbi:hypothetical protein [Rhodococcoides fascians]|uniref:hypothetical protein n=1 Tax=Rhodococcoides fascians TaxID=1828 RepID=UPI00068DA055|nr:hypothetical protein [Rhodococcus fascians]